MQTGCHILQTSNYNPEKTAVKNVRKAQLKYADHVWFGVFFLIGTIFIALNMF